MLCYGVNSALSFCFFVPFGFYSYLIELFCFVFIIHKDGAFPVLFGWGFYS